MFETVDAQEAIEKHNAMKHEQYAETHKEGMSYAVYGGREIITPVSLTYEKDVFSNKGFLIMRFMHSETSLRADSFGAHDYVERLN